MLIRGVAWLSVIVTSLATLIGISIVADGNYCWSAFAFSMTASPVSAAMLFLGVVPSWLRYRRTGHPHDQVTLQLAGYSFLVLVMEAVALQVIPQRGE